MLAGVFCSIALGLAHCSPPGQLAVQPDGSILRDGARVGLYVDNEDPSERADAAAAVAAGNRIVIAGAYPFGPLDRQPGVIAAREWYPYCGRAIYPIRPPPAPAGTGYIVQWRFAWPGCPPPTDVQRRQLRRAAVARRPRLVLLY